jgi:AcrR family transcriptional regulator
MWHVEGNSYDIKRNAIFEAALEEFGSSGFAGTSMRSVAERAGLAKGTLYLYFKDKDELFDRTLEYGWELFFAETMKLLEAGTSVLDRLVAMADLGLVKLMLSRNLLRGMLFEASRRELVAAKVDKLCAVIGGIIGERPENSDPSWPSEWDDFIRLIISGVLFEVSMTPTDALAEKVAKVGRSLKTAISGLLPLERNS